MKSNSGKCNLILGTIEPVEIQVREYLKKSITRKNCLVELLILNLDFANISSKGCLLTDTLHDY